ncbi:diphthamide biosynthesis protein 3-like [Olea europaea var. sylvestris]|uniref:diphthamide biosynthesis protein 3-like n=1 Tax=Olea europaea var. sylvestris TaxID=158386 RepID=UPI000C1D1FAD|nr:diphthamide biosynthesis protein 3-like [Olea europaea var. sylvestris]
MRGLQRTVNTYKGVRVGVGVDIPPSNRFVIWPNFSSGKTLVGNTDCEKKKKWKGENPRSTPNDDVEIEDMEWNEELQAFTYPCPCGDLFQITKEDLRIGEEVARCPSCSLYITVIYNIEDFQESKRKIEPEKQQPVAVA